LKIALNYRKLYNEETERSDARPYCLFSVVTHKETKTSRSVEISNAW